MRKICLSALGILIGSLMSFSASSQPLTSLTLKDTTVKELQAIYNKYGYSHYLIVKDAKIPPIFLEHFPQDFDKLPASDERNELFIRIVTPLALKLNQEIMAEREQMLELEKKYQAQKTLNPEEEQALEALAKKYDVFTRLKGEERIKLYFNQLKIKINQVYPSFLISIAAVETDWGSSRIVKEANSLYKELVWHTPEGLTPQGEDEDHTYKIRIFPNLYESMKSYALKFNSDISYEHARFLRDLRYRSQMVPSGKGVVHAMLFQTPLKNYIGLLDYTITFYQLMLLDQATLATRLEPNSEILAHSQENIAKITPKPPKR